MAPNSIHPLVEDPDAASSARSGLPVVVIGAGPVGLAAAAHLLDRGLEPLLVRVRDGRGQLHDLQARAVVDASGTWTQPNPLGASGLPARGEIDAGSQIVYGLPDIAGHDRDRYAGRRVVVVGAGHSAATSLLALAELQRQAPATETPGRSARPLRGHWSARAAPRPASFPPAGGWPPTWPTWSTPVASS